MPTWTALDADPVTGDGLDVVILEFEGRTIDLRSNFAAAGLPGSPVEGQIAVDKTASPYAVWVFAKIDAGAAAWQPIGPLSRLPGSINADPSTTDDRAAPYQHKALRVENRGAVPTATAGNAGMLVYLTGTGELQIADQPVSGGWKNLLSAAPSSLDSVDLELSGDTGNDGTNPPTQSAQGVLEGWLFDATAEKRTFAVIVPKNWDGGSDLKLRLWQVLDAAETGGDDIEWTGEVRCLPPAGGKASQTATVLADAVTDIGADAEGIDAGGGPHVSDLVVDFDDATNPVSVGSLLLITVNRKTVGGAGKVAGTLVFRAALLYQQRARHERA